MNIVIDVGNTRLKAGIFSQEKLEEKISFDSKEHLQEFLHQKSFENALISSVGITPAEIVPWVNVTEKKWVLSPLLSLPIQNLYATPETLGADRIAAVCGALSLFPEKNCLVIDAGSCITYDLVDQQGNYWGGSISPGLEMRLKAMHTFTARLPLVKLNKQVNLIGDTTERCLQSGALFGVLTEIEGIIEKYRANYPELKVIMCGGDASLFENQLKPTIFAAPDLVLKGLNRILLQNASY
jgi:type III pantothenate kinase